MGVGVDWGLGLGLGLGKVGWGWVALTRCDAMRFEFVWLDSGWFDSI